MRFLRASAKALFYDYPLNRVAEYLQGLLPAARLLDLFEPILSRQHSSFTCSEIKQMQVIVESQWLYPESNSLRHNPKFADDVIASFKLLEKCTDTFLTINDNRPFVKFPQLLRWRELSHYVGEDLLSIAALVKSDLEKNYDINRRNNFFWEDVLNHDCRELNRIFDAGLADNHAHLDASSDIFSFNWLALMNNPELLKTRLSKANLDFIDNSLREYDPIAAHSPVNPTLRQWIYLATTIRVMLSCMVDGRKDLYNRSFKSVLNIVRNINYVKLSTSPATEIINILKADGLRTFHRNITLDYAIPNNLINTLTAEEIASPFMIHYGERSLIYKLLYIINSRKHDDDRVPVMFYLYLLIKNKVRREFVQCNILRGFENFQRHQDIKTSFFDSTMKELSRIYAVKSSLAENPNNTLEARITPGAVDGVIAPYLYCPIFAKSYNDALGKNQLQDNRGITGVGGFSKQWQETLNRRLSFVVHFIKSDKTLYADSKTERHPYRHGDLRFKTWNELDQLLSKIQKQNLPFNITGIDVAGAELNCRPEIFSPMFRHAKYCGLKNVTYHAGEDFYDLVDGIRAIHELILFMDYEHGDRIGHALALATDARRYYEQRENIVIIPQQILLDNLVWLKYYSMKSGIKLEEKTLYFIEENSAILMQKIGYKHCTMFEYFQSMTMRGDDIVEHPVKSLKTLVKHCKTYRDTERLDMAVELHRQYESDLNVIENGLKPMELKLPATFAEDVIKVQQGVLKMLDKRVIQIETNPTSNIKIGFFRKYSELPIFKFHSPKRGEGLKLNVSVNTDDRGVFHTSARNEMSLLAIAMKKQKDERGNYLYNFDEIKEYIDKLDEMGREMTFPACSPG